MLPPKKVALPLTPQELRPDLAKLFPFAPKDGDDFRDHVEKLRKYYAFVRLPNDYIKAKMLLPKDPEKVVTQKVYKFPIESTEELTEFIAEIESRYRYPVPLPSKYSELNPTDKPELPHDHTQISVNLTIPITTPKRLVETARLLRRYYFFKKIPDSWIDIPETITNEHDKVDQLPKSVEALRDYMEMKKIEETDIFPVTSYEKLPRAMEILGQHFSLTSLPTYLNKLQDLPQPEWNLFSST